jgi:hypothetical protein
MSKLIIRTGYQVGTEIPVDRPLIRIGRGSGNDIVLQDSQASRHHAEVFRQGEQCFVRDLGSTNGTFVDGERLAGPRLLQPGDQIQIGETILGFQPSPATAVPPGGDDWEAGSWEEGTEVHAAGGQPRWLIWAIAGLVGVLVVAVTVAAVLLLRGDKEEPGPVAAVTTAAPTQAIEVAATVTSASAMKVDPTSTPLVELPTSELLPTAEVQVTAPPVNSPVAPKPPQQAPVSLQELEQLPQLVQEYLGDVPPEQLPEVISQQMQSMSQEQLEQIIGALFPGVNPATLPQVVAASFPGLSTRDVEGLMQMAFPDQNIQIPEMGIVEGRLLLGSYDQGRSVWDLYTVNATGSGRRLLVEQASEPDFAPDGQWIVYYSWKPDRLGLRLVKSDGTGNTSLTTVTDHYYPSFSPDGNQISFYNSDTNAVHVINRDGSSLREITKGEFPAWSPVGNQIVYRGCLEGGRCGLIVANADGANPQQITTHANDAAPRWSPNGGQITFHSDRDGNWEIYVINADGSWLRRITINPTTDIMPVWSPDGLRIAFRSDRGGQGAVWVTSGIGGPATKLLDAGFNPAHPNLAMMDWR